MNLASSEPRCGRKTGKHSLWVLMLMLTLVDAEMSPECSMTYPCADKLGQGAAYAKPVQLTSPGRPWIVNLTVDIGTITFDWLQLKRRLYNGGIPGPTITVRRGDVLTLNLKNNLSPVGNELGVGLNQRNHPNTTNIHTHGLHISAQDPQDNVLVSVEPGSKYQYVYQIHPHHAAGTLYYHAHHHEAAGFQVQSGLAGMIIVEDDPSDMPPELNAASCPSHCENDIQLFFQDSLMYVDDEMAFWELQRTMHDYVGFGNFEKISSGNTTLVDWLSRNVNYFITNGQLQPSLEMSTSQIYRFRMVNAGGQHTLELYIADGAGNPTSKCEIREIALDGIYLPKPRILRGGQTLLVAGAKADWLVKCDTPGTYKLASYPRKSNAASIGLIKRYDDVLATLVVSGAKSVKNFPSSLPSLAPYLRDLQNADETEIKARFTVELGPSETLNREKWSHPVKYRYGMRLNELQEWNFLNSDNRSHPLHMHVNHFQVISYNNYTGGIGVSTDDESNWYLVDMNDQTDKCYYQHAGFDPEINVEREERYPPVIDGELGLSQIGDYRDTLLIPPLTNVTVRFIPRDYVGDVIIHCHILQHEDRGMMMAAKIVNEVQSTSANVKSGGAYPGTCRLTDRYPPNSAYTLAEEIEG